MTRSLFRTFALLALLAFALTAPAAAQNSPLEGYSDQGAKTQSEVQGQTQGTDGDQPSGSDGASSGATRSSDGGTLPFTGADLGWFGAAGLTLLLVGFALRRLTAPARLR